MNLTILHLYPKEMNLYGDHGNVLVLKRRCEWRGIKVNIIEHNIGDELPAKCDIIFGGGGQDSGQQRIAEDLRNNGKALKAWAEDGMPTLLVCGIYQLFGNFFKMQDGVTIEGISVLDIETEAGDKRLIGNIVIESGKFGDIVGYENHSGLTELGNDIKPLGKVTRGYGNNGSDGAEGVFYKNTIGTYMHGPLLPKNPRIADFLIKTALERKYGAQKDFEKLPDKLEQKARKIAMERPR
ncbi:MAG: glutamine amidotransferase [Candidatus Nomurabacteria bacterium]|jgi:CobQ-like glutamine amidotransferase family enzyme|nr:glutamine amidotransferase [Candidatus Nomurabacteria bacterium]